MSLRHQKLNRTKLKRLAKKYPENEFIVYEYEALCKFIDGTEDDTD